MEGFWGGGEQMHTIQVWWPPASTEIRLKITIVYSCNMQSRFIKRNDTPCAHAFCAFVPKLKKRPHPESTVKLHRFPAVCVALFVPARWRPGLCSAASVWVGRASTGFCQREPCSSAAA